MSKPLNISNGTPAVPPEIQWQPLPINELNGTPPQVECPISNLHRPKSKKVVELLTKFYEDTGRIELCLDEVGRGCLFGRTYIACVVLPKENDAFDGSNIKDSKKFSSKKKIKEVSDYIKAHALHWHVAYVENDVIDKINILQAVMKGMHECIKTVLEQHVLDKKNVIAVVDGNYFTPYRWFDNEAETICELPAVTVEQGDAKYMGIAAASILAKVARDEYIQEMCSINPLLVEHYGLDTNMGYGTKKHMEGIRQHGITSWHRRTFGEICRNAVKNEAF